MPTNSPSEPIHFLQADATRLPLTDKKLGERCPLCGGIYQTGWDLPNHVALVHTILTDEVVPSIKYLCHCGETLCLADMADHFRDVIANEGLLMHFAEAALINQ